VAGVEGGVAGMGTVGCGLRTDTETGLAAADVFLSDNFQGEVELVACGGDSEPLWDIWASILRRCRCDGFWNERGEVDVDASDFSLLGMFFPDEEGTLRDVMLAVAVSAIIVFISTLDQKWSLTTECSTPNYI
jgi:hypothetical protein